MLKSTIKTMMYYERVTQKELGNRLGINQQSVSALLNRDMGVSKLVAICEALGYELVARKGRDEYDITPGHLDAGDIEFL